MAAPIIPIAPDRSLVVIPIHQQHVDGNSPRGCGFMAELLNPDDFRSATSFHRAVCGETSYIDHPAARQMERIDEEKRPLPRRALAERNCGSAFCNANFDNRHAVARQFHQRFMFAMGVLGQDRSDSQPCKHGVARNRAPLAEGHRECALYGILRKAIFVCFGINLSRVRFPLLVSGIYASGRLPPNPGLPDPMTKVASNLIASSSTK